MMRPIVWLFPLIAILGCVAPNSHSQTNNAVIPVNITDLPTIIQALNDGKTIHCVNTISSDGFHQTVDVYAKKMGHEYRIRTKTTIDTGSPLGNTEVEDLRIVNEKTSELRMYVKVPGMGVERWMETTLPYRINATQYLNITLTKGTDKPLTIEGPVNITSQCEIIDMGNGMFEIPKNIYHPVTR